MFDQFVDWVTTTLGATYQYSRGMWVDSPAVNNLRICAIQQTGGLAPDVDDRRQRYRVILLGPRNGRADTLQLEADIEALAQVALDGAAPCGAAFIRAIGEPVGPGFTSENRPWYRLDFEVLF